MTATAAPTDLQRYILAYLCEQGDLDPDGALLARGATATIIAQRSNDWYRVPAVVRCLTGMVDETPGWVRQVKGPGVPAAGMGRQWVASPEGAAAVGWAP